MSHGSKKWIKDYRGRIKRSRNRTKIDRYAGLKQWEWWHYGSIRYGNSKEAPFCPQCKHVQKAIQNDVGGYRAAEKKIREEWHTVRGDRYWVVVDGKNVYYHDFFRSHKDYPGHLWNYDTRSYLCFKHERMYEQERAMWDHHQLGVKKTAGYTVKEGRRHYRHMVKNIMNRAKYDEELYDDIPPYKHDWLN